MHVQQDGFNLNPKRQEQHSALVIAIAEILWQARTGTCAFLVTPPPENGPGASGLGYVPTMNPSC